MNILITAPSLNESENVSGISTVVRTIIESEAGIDDFFHFRIGTKDGEGKGFRWVREQLTLLPRMAAFLRRNKIEAVHLNTDLTKMSLLRDVVIFWFMHNVCRKPVLLHLHGGHMLMAPPRRGSFFGVVIAYMLRHAKLTVVLSKLEQEQLLKNFGVRSKALPNAVPISPVPPRMRTFEGKLRFVFFGRIVKIKGIYLIAEALKQLSSALGDFSLTVYGSGPEQQNWMAQLEAIKGLDVTYKGIARGKEKWKALNEADVFLLPSISGEGLPVAMLEAMQCGCVPVVSDDASITTVVNHSINGFVVSRGNQQELTDTLRELLLNRAHLSAMSEAAKHTVRDHYGVSDYMQKLSAFYSLLTKLNQGPLAEATHALQPNRN